MALSQRYAAEEACMCSAGIVNKVCSPEELKESAITTANQLGRWRIRQEDSVDHYKHDIYKDVYHALKEPARFYSRLWLMFI